MIFENYKLRLLEDKDTISFFQLIENNRTRLEDFIAGITARTKNLANTETFIKDKIEKKCKQNLFSLPDN